MVDTSAQAGPATAGPPAQQGRRERKKAELRLALQEAAVRLSAEVGYEHVTVEAIAEACDVSVRTFFNYFSSKDEAVLGPVLDHRRQMHSAFEARPSSETAIESLRAASIELARSLLADQEQWIARRQIFTQNPSLLPRMHAAFAEFEQELTGSVAARLGLDPITDPYPALLVALAITSLRVAVMHSRRPAVNCGITGEDLPELVARLFDTTFTTVQTPEIRSL